MKRILFAWIGLTDLKAAESGGKDGLGPIAQVVATGDYSKAVLLDNYGPDKDVAGYLAWLGLQCATELEVRKVELDDPTDHGAIYQIAERAVVRELGGRTGWIVPVFHLSPGTPAMHAVWVLLGKARFQGAELVSSSREKGATKVRIPFDISAEFAPAFAKAADLRLAELSEGLPPSNPEIEKIVHRCEAMKKTVARARIVATRDVPVLIEGETGTGKELFARAIHAESERRGRPFISVNCGAIPKELFEAEFFGCKKGAYTGADKDRAGYFEAANGGTLFLDELGELPLDAQVKVLRVLNDGQVVRLGENSGRSVDVRIIAATNRELLQEVAAGRFRADLFYRLAVAMLKLPPLRERQGDLGLLMESMLAEVNAELSAGRSYEGKSLSVPAKNLMLQHPWPGNARELFNTIMRICVWCPGKKIEEDDVRQALLPSQPSGAGDILLRPLDDGFKLQDIIDYISSEYIARALREAKGNKTRAAQLLGMKNYQTLSNWMAKLGIDD